jgi:putative ABC transport system permease protein
VPHAQWNEAANGGARRTMAVVARTGGDPYALVPRIREIVRAHDAAVPLSNVRTIERIVMDAFSQPRFTMLLLAIFAGLALVLAALGIYGVIAYGVAQRAQEIGIRMALGATAGDVLRLVVGGGLTLAVIGIAAGVGGALALSRLMASLVYGVDTLDPLTFAAVPVLLVGVALLASLLPALKAAAVQPGSALKSE